MISLLFQFFFANKLRWTADLERAGQIWREMEELVYSEKILASPGCKLLVLKWDNLSHWGFNLFVCFQLKQITTWNNDMYQASMWGLKFHLFGKSKQIFRYKWKSLCMFKGRVGKNLNKRSLGDYKMCGSHQIQEILQPEILGDYRRNIAYAFLVITLLWASILAAVQEITQAYVIPCLEPGNWVFMLMHVTFKPQRMIGSACNSSWVVRRAWEGFCFNAVLGIAQ